MRRSVLLRRYRYAMDPSRWSVWARALAGARDDREVRCALENIASEIRDTGVATDWSRVGVAVRRRKLTGRLGGIVQRSGKSVVLLSDRVSNPEAGFITAHEVGHLLLTSALGVVKDEEELCDAFAKQVTRS